MTKPPGASLAAPGKTRQGLDSQPPLPDAMRQWLAHLQANRRYSPHTLAAYRRDLHWLCERHADVAPEGFTEHHIRQAIAHLHRDGLSPRSLARALAAWRGFFGWWAPRSGMPGNPAQGVRAPKAARSLPKALSVEQAQALLDRPGRAIEETVAALRDQAMAEVLYSSGLRLSELVSLDWRHVRQDGYASQSWISLDEAEATVCGKGGKTRTVPLGAQAVAAVRRWLEVRPQWASADPADIDAQAALFLGARGRRIAHRVVQLQIGRMAAQAGLPVGVHPHSLRHSFASHVLQSAQDLRAVQEMLGHANISTTQIYTRLDFQHLAQVYDKAHPRAQRKS